MTTLPGEHLWLPHEVTKNVVSNSFQAMERLAADLKNTDFSEMSEKDKGQLFAYIAKAVNEIVRLHSFSKGEADSRTEIVGLNDLLQYLTNEQFQQVQEWIAEGKAASQASLVSSAI